MKKKITFIVVLTIIMTCIFTPPIYERFQKAEVNLVAPMECRVGELVVLDASESKMDNITWNISPLTTNFKIIDGGKQAIFSSEEIGNYVITVAVVNGKKVDLSIIELLVYNPTPLIDLVKPLIDADGVKDLIDKQKEQLPGPVKQIIDFDQIKNMVDTMLHNNDKPNENQLPPGIKLFDTTPTEEEVNIHSWLPSKDPVQLNRIIKSLNILINLMDKDRFETQDEMVQAAIWSIKHSTHEDEAWKPFAINFQKYLENSTSKQDCIQKIGTILTCLHRINNAKT